ncbi:hypothetical protein [uncultured Alsobacter sp.]|uniref:hypothetical protein n=1 Tax=uncultured Alsobacter sp. TaxID=1748258 RepID=UPI0025CBC15C|nr:hypothetical protein [uncultured Alsobacter sp.]
MLFQVLARSALRAALLSAVLGAASPVQAAAIDSRRLDNGVVLIFISGEMVLGDEKTFANVALPHENAIVVFKSNGGNLKAGIEIGKAIRIKGFSTFVSDGESCASACALAWLGGRNRAMSGTARVGFHAAHVQTGDVKVATSVGNALVGAYVAQLGLPERAVVYVTSAAPDEIKWLTFADAQSIGIDVRQVNLNDGPSRSTPGTASAPPSSPPTPPPGSWGQYGDWIQVFSRPTMLEATQIATEVKRRFDNTYVFRYVNGWYAVVIGPFPQGSGVARKDALVATGAIPNDSLIARTERMAEVVYGGTPSPAPSVASAAPATGSSAEQRARDFMATLQARWSMDNGTAMATLQEAYAEVVTYYGKPLGKQTVLDEKRAFAQRWPERTYSVRPGTVTASCSPDGRLCDVNAITDWRAASAARGTISTGAATYQLQLRLEGGRIAIVGESGAILNRAAARY